MTNEFVGPAQPSFIENLLVVQYDRVFDSAPEREAGAMQRFDFVRKTEGSRRREVALENLLIEARHLEGLAPDTGMVEIDRIGDPQFIRRIDPNRTIALEDFDRLLDRELGSRSGLRRSASAPEAVDEVGCTSVHGRNLGAGNLDPKIVDLEGKEGGEEMLDGRDLPTCNTIGEASIGRNCERRCPRRRMNGFDACGNLDVGTGGVVVSLSTVTQGDEYDPGARSGGTESDLDLFAAV